MFPRCNAYIMETCWRKRGADLSLWIGSTGQFAFLSKANFGVSISGDAKKLAWQGARGRKELYTTQCLKQTSLDCSMWDAEHGPELPAVFAAVGYDWIYFPTR